MDRSIRLRDLIAWLMVAAFALTGIALLRIAGGEVFIALAGGLTMYAAGILAGLAIAHSGRS